MPRTITFYLPGMFRLDGQTGKYPAISITGDDCALDCEHCKTKILKPMIRADDPDMLVAACRRLAERGQHGALVSGGCLEDGRLPWERFAPAIARVKQETGLIISVHAGFIDDAQARLLKEAGADQALIDVIGDDETLQRIYHVDFGVERIRQGLAALHDARLPSVPHVVCGIDFGRIRGETKALDMIADYDPEQVVIVSLMGIPGTPMHKVQPPAAEEVAEVIAHARRVMPDTRLSLGCARQRGNPRLEVLAVRAGIDRLALPSPEAIAEAERLGLDIRYQKTCCSVGCDLSGPSWTEGDKPDDGLLAASF
jgi:hypothetical protein